MPRILLQQGTNLVNKFALLLHKCRFAQDSRDKPENDGSWRYWLSICCSFLNYPSPADKSATSPARGEVLNNITFKGLDAVLRQYAVLFERQKTHTTETAESGVDKVVSSCEKNPSVLKTYTNFLRQRKTALDAPLYAVSSGRSMIEMLGVLAIIGVLSVGGIAGYSKAMMKFKINKTIEQIEQITYVLFTAFANQKDFNNIIFFEEDGVNFMKSLGIISDDMIVDGEFGKELISFFGKNIFVDAGTDPFSYPSNPNSKFINIEYENIPREACMTLGSLNWENSSAAVIGIGLNPLTSNSGAPSECWFYSPIINQTYGKGILVCNNAEKDDNYIPLPIPPDVVSKYCNCPNDTCYFGIAFTDR